MVRPGYAVNRWYGKHINDKNGRLVYNSSEAWGIDDENLALLRNTIGPQKTEEIFKYERKAEIKAYKGWVKFVNTLNKQLENNAKRNKRIISDNTFNDYVEDIYVNGKRRVTVNDIMRFFYPDLEGAFNEFSDNAFLHDTGEFKYKLLSPELQKQGQGPEQWDAEKLLVFKYMGGNAIFPIIYGRFSPQDLAYANFIKTDEEKETLVDEIANILDGRTEEATGGFKWVNPNYGIPEISENYVMGENGLMDKAIGERNFQRNVDGQFYYTSYQKNLVKLWNHIRNEKNYGGLYKKLYDGFLEEALGGRDLAGLKKDSPEEANKIIHESKLNTIKQFADIVEAETGETVFSSIDEGVEFMEELDKLDAIKKAAWQPNVGDVVTDGTNPSQKIILTEELKPFIHAGVFDGKEYAKATKKAPPYADQATIAAALKNKPAQFDGGKQSKSKDVAIDDKELIQYFTEEYGTPPKDLEKIKANKGLISDFKLWLKEKKAQEAPQKEAPKENPKASGKKEQAKQSGGDYNWASLGVKSYDELVDVLAKKGWDETKIKNFMEYKKIPVPQPKSALDSAIEEFEEFESIGAPADKKKGAGESSKAKQGGGNASTIDNTLWSDDHIKAMRSFSETHPQYVGPNTIHFIVANAIGNKDPEGIIAKLPQGLKGTKEINDYIDKYSGRNGRGRGTWVPSSQIYQDVSGENVVLPHNHGLMPRRATKPSKTGGFVNSTDIYDTSSLPKDKLLYKIPGRKVDLSEFIYDDDKTPVVSASKDEKADKKSGKKSDKKSDKKTDKKSGKKSDKKAEKKSDAGTEKKTASALSTNDMYLALDSMSKDNEACTQRFVKACDNLYERISAMDEGTATKIAKSCGSDSTERFVASVVKSTFIRKGIDLPDVGEDSEDVSNFKKSMADLQKNNPKAFSMLTECVKKAMIEEAREATLRKDEEVE